MKLEFHEADRDRLWPECVNALKAVPESETFHDEWGLRQPLGLYNSSVGTLPRHFANVLSALEGLRGLPDTGKDTLDVRTRLLDAHKALLYALLEHLEDCRNLTKSFFPKAKFTDKEPSVRNFKNVWDQFRDPLGHIVNAMKHRQARLGFFQASNTMVKLPGYSVQVAVERGTIGPDPQIHGISTAGKNRVAAISFGHDLRRHFCAIYVIGHHLAKFVLETQRSSMTGSTLNSGTDKKDGVCSWAFETAEKIAKLLPFVYPQETELPTPIVEVFSDVSLSPQSAIRGRMIGIEFSTKIKPPTFAQMPGGRINLMAIFEGDGATRSFKVP